MLNVDVDVDGTGPGVIQADEVADDNDSEEDIVLEVVVRLWLGH